MIGQASWTMDMYKAAGMGINQAARALDMLGSRHESRSISMDKGHVLGSSHVDRSGSADIEPTCTYKTLGMGRDRSLSMVIGHIYCIRLLDRSCSMDVGYE